MGQVGKTVVDEVILDAGAILAQVNASEGHQVQVNLITHLASRGFYWGIDHPGNCKAVVNLKQ